MSTHPTGKTFNPGDIPFQTNTPYRAYKFTTIVRDKSDAYGGVFTKISPILASNDLSAMTQYCTLPSIQELDQDDIVSVTIESRPYDPYNSKS